MSQYPYNPGWGYNHPYPAPAPPPPPQQYGYPNHSPYPGQPAYGQTYEYNVPPTAAEAHHSSSQHSFNYNANNIPGLGAAPPEQGGPPYHVGFAPNPWDQQQQHHHHQQQQQQQQQQQPHSYSSYNHSPQAPFAQHPPYHDQQAQYIPPPVAPSTYQRPPQPQHISQPVPQISQPIASIEMEEGELSECQFEDLYEESRESSQPAPGVGVGPPTGPPSRIIYRLATSTSISQPTSAADTPDGGFYESDENERQEAPDAPGKNDQERSKSYSPFFSPAESEQSEPQEAPAQEGDAGTASPGLQLSVSQQTNTAESDNDPKCDSPAQQDPVDYMSSFKSVREGKKEAQKAILRLWHMGVKYQNYIEEGFDPQIIKNLFGDLNLDMPKTPTDSPPTKPKDSQSPKPDEAVEVQQMPSVTMPADSASMPQKSKGEERKDRIARLLALKAAKGPAAPAPKPAAAPPKPDSQQSALESQPQTTASAPPSGPKTKQWDEKNRLLQAKIAALQAQKNASEKANGDKSNTSLGQVNSGQAHNQASQAQPAPFIPSLSQSPGPQTRSANQRKRPVAADFVEYQSSTGPHKRPFGQARKETPLIIDVSEASDDEEMDMDLGSADEDAASVPPRGPPLPRGASIRDFPPLTPVPSQTPPGGFVNGKKRDTELSLKEKEIQEIKRKIALAEAKRKAKHSSGGSLTPVQANQTPELQASKLPQFPHRGREPGSIPAVSETESMSLKVSKARLDPLQKAERRGRIVSLDIPRVDSSLEEKLSRLQRLREEEALLQAEIDRELTEKKLLAEELEQLETSSTNTPNANGAVAVQEQEISVPQAGDGSVDVAMAFSSESSAPSSESQASGDASMGENVCSPKASEQETSSKSPQPEAAAGDVNASADAGQAEPDVVVTEATEQALEEETPAPRSESISSDSRAADVSPPTIDSEQHLSDVDISVTTPVVDRVADVAPPIQSEAPEVSQTSSLDLHDPEDTAKTDETIPMDLESRSPSPAAPTPTVAVSDTSEARQSSVPMPEHISGVAGLREEAQEIEPQARQEVNANYDTSLARQTTNNTLVAYESPLRYFRAYRFHPDYFKNVAGGLKSLTYTNRIDPHKQLCPYELRHEQCAADCEYQHLKSVEVPENQILLELGNADHVPVDQKPGFINGLRDLLKGFKTNKVKDFDVIARGIIEYRSQFLGDRSKVLNLEGVLI
ncbi:protein red1 [Podospora fimiseda]|uniref:Protein red1 n=1 Tax=Podospora fimiseda TaxID=252190 RepID=A0AAN7C038_9PEZI|nr:protein red1 [Podospora fimiseda]